MARSGEDGCDECRDVSEGQCAPFFGCSTVGGHSACLGDADRITTVDVLDRLLAEMLREYGIRSSTIRMPNGQTPKGY